MRLARLLALMLGTALAVCLSSTALAVGGGSSGSSSMPSMSAPTYDPVAEYQRGVAALQANDFKTADRSFSNASEAAPKDSNIWFMLGVAKTGRNDLKGARKAYERAVKYEPGKVLAHQELAITLAKLNEKAKAQEELGVLKQTAQTCGDACPDATALKQAVATVEAALNGTPSARLTLPAPPTAGAGDSAYLQAVSLINQHRYGEALTALDEAREAFGPHPDVITYQGYVNRKLGAIGKAEAYYQQALTLDPGHRGAMEYYGELKVLRGDVAGAKALLAKLDRSCSFGCSQAEDLRSWIAHGGDPSL